MVNEKIRELSIAELTDIRERAKEDEMLSSLINMAFNCLAHKDAVAALEHDLKQYMEIAKDQANHHAGVMKIVNGQAEDEGLWFITQNITEAKLQAALRLLHGCIEAK